MGKEKQKTEKGFNSLTFIYANVVNAFILVVLNALDTLTFRFRFI